MLTSFGWSTKTVNKLCVFLEFFSLTTRYQQLAVARRATGFYFQIQPIMNKNMFRTTPLTVFLTKFGLDFPVLFKYLDCEIEVTPRALSYRDFGLVVVQNSAR